jgi:hypothetical protein
LGALALFRPPANPLRLQRLLVPFLPFALAATAQAQNWFYDQPLSPNGGTLRQSQLWIDPTGQNDSDNDSLAWEDFTLPQNQVITHVRWVGETAPPLGFQISFFHQDPGTIAVQPDIVAVGSGPISEEIVTSFTVTPVGSLFRFEAQLATPVFAAANTRYFLSVVGRTPYAYASWRWAQGTNGTSGTFWWQRGMHMYFMLGDNRAMSLGTSFPAFVGTAACSGDGTSGTCPCGNSRGPVVGCRNSTREGAVLVATGSASVSADDLVLTTLAMPRNQSCLMFVSPNVINGVPFGDGLRCLTGPLSRFPVRNSGATGVLTEGAGLASWSLTHLASPNQFLAGRTLGFQTWYRDTNGPCGQLTNVSSARVVTFAP